MARCQDRPERGGKNPIAGYVRARMHRRLFAWLAATIAVTGVLVFLSVRLFADDAMGWRLERARAFVGARFAEAWSDPHVRDELASAIALDLDADVTVRDDEGRTLAAFGEPCRRGPRNVIAVARGDARLGSVAVCWERHRGRALLRTTVPLGLAVLALWFAAGVLARRLTRPVVELARVAEEIGEGRFASRARLAHRRHGGELDLLARVIGEMAAKVEKQLEGQRALMAAVSHEIRTPLAHMRLLVELARGRLGGDDPAFVELEAEIAAVDRLVADLLASARVDFAALVPMTLDAEAVAREALTRAALPEDLLVVSGARETLAFRGDPTLIARALANLLANAEAHGGGVVRLVARGAPTCVAFDVEDEGSGIAPGEDARVFEPFTRGTGAKGGSVGLGLSLVRRIAEAHGGRAYTRARTPRGAVVGIELARAPTSAVSVG